MLEGKKFCFFLSFFRKRFSFGALIKCKPNQTNTLFFFFLKEAGCFFFHSLNIFELNLYVSSHLSISFIHILLYQFLNNVFITIEDLFYIETLYITNAWFSKAKIIYFKLNYFILRYTPNFISIGHRYYNNCVTTILTYRPFSVFIWYLLVSKKHCINAG